MPVEGRNLKARCRDAFFGARGGLSYGLGMSRVGLIFGGRTVEHEVSVASARTVRRGLIEAGHEVAPLGIGPDGCWLPAAQALPALEGGVDQLPPGCQPVAASLAPLLAAEVEVVFPIIHGTWGEDGSLQGFCEMMDLPYVGAGVTASAVAMDKVLCKQVLSAVGLPVVEAEVVTAAQWAADRAAALERAGRLPWPLFVKPAVGGSSVGVTRVARQEALAGAIDLALRFDGKALIERGVDGRELECALLGGDRLEASVVGEVVPGKAFYDYADKYLDLGAQLLAPAELTEEIGTRVRALSVEAFAAVGGFGMARVDFLLEADGGLSINEINTLPGFTDISMYPRLWGLTGYPLPALVDRLVAHALERHQTRTALDDGIKAWIAALQDRR